MASRVIGQLGYKCLVTNMA